MILHLQQVCLKDIISALSNKETANLSNGTFMSFFIFINFPFGKSPADSFVESPHKKALQKQNKIKSHSFSSYHLSFCKTVDRASVIQVSVLFIY